MNFSVFFAAEADKHIVERMGKPGLDMLDLVREENPDIRHLPASEIEIDNTCPIDRSYVSISLDENLARATGLFKGTTRVDVSVREGSLTKYVKFVKDPRFKTETVDIGFTIFGQTFGRKTVEVMYRCRFESKFDRDALLQDWAAAGFPTSWEV